MRRFIKNFMVGLPELQSEFPIRFVRPGVGLIEGTATVTLRPLKMTLENKSLEQFQSLWYLASCRKG